MAEDCPARLTRDRGDASRGAESGFHDAATRREAQERAAKTLDDGEEARVSHIVTHYSVLPPPWGDVLRRASICCWSNRARGERAPRRGFSGELPGAAPSVPCAPSCSESSRARWLAFASRASKVFSLVIESCHSSLMAVICRFCPRTVSSSSVMRFLSLKGSNISCYDRTVCRHAGSGQHHRAAASSRTIRLSFVSPASGCAIAKNGRFARPLSSPTLLFYLSVVKREV